MPTSTVGRRERGRSRRRLRHRRPRQERRELLAHPRDPGPATGGSACRGSAGRRAAARVPHRRQTRPASVSATAAPQTSQRASSPHMPARRAAGRGPCGSGRTPPGAAVDASRASAAASASVSKPRAGRLVAHGRRRRRAANRRARTGGPGAPERPTRGLGLERRRRAHERARARRRARARSSATSRACHVGARSSSSASSPSSRTTIAREVRNRREHRDPATDDDARPGRARFHARGAHARRARSPRVTITSRPRPRRSSTSARTRLESGATTIVDPSSATSAPTTSCRPPPVATRAGRARRR